MKTSIHSTARAWLASAAALLSGSVATAGLPEIVAGPIQVQGSNHSYYLLAPSTVDEAKEVAVSLGGRLASFESLTELTLVQDALSNWNGIPRSCWIGLSDSTTEGDWRWSTGEPRLFTSWASDEPTDDPTRNDAYMAPTGRWFTADGSQAVDGETPLHSIVEIGNVDCNGNFFPDDIDILDGESLDLDGDGVPDECQSVDCDANGRADAVEILVNPWLDCNGDDRIDACAALENPRSDCNGNLIDDECESPDATGFLATYFTNQSLETPIRSRIDQEVNLSTDGEPWPGAGFSDFAARWTGELDAAFTGFYSFWITSDDGIRLFIDGELVIDDWRPHSPEEVSTGLFLTAGRHVFTLEWFDSGGGALCQLEWQPPFSTRQLMPGSVMRPFIDCDEDGQLDGCQIAFDPSLDCNANGQLDSCEDAATDCDGNGIFDWCELVDNDCDGDGVPDNCELADGAPDCQLDGILDACQIGDVRSVINDDGSPEYGVRAAGEYMAWLQHARIDEPHARSIAIEVDFVFAAVARPVRVCLWRDPNGDGVPDDAELVHITFTQVESNEAGVFDRIELPNIDLGPSGGSYFFGAMMGGVTEEDFPAALDASTPYAGGSWIVGSEQPLDPEDLDGEGVIEFTRLDELGPGVWWSNWALRFEYETSTGDCDNDGVPDDCQIAAGELLDLDGNGVADACEDCDADGIVDACELTCDGDCGTIWDTTCGLEEDCNQDGIPDSCQDAFNGLPDCDGNGIPDSCDDPDLDCDGNGIIDTCEIANGTAEDCDADGVIDACQLGGVPEYRIDTGIVSDTIGFAGPGPTWWAVQYEVGPGSGAGVIDHIEVAVGDLGLGTLVQVGLMADPDQDGGPADMVPLALATLEPAGPNAPGQGEPILTRFDFDPIDVGPAGTTFFVAAHVDPVAAVLPTVVDFGPFEGRSYIGRGGSLEEITVSYSLGGLGIAGEWIMRAGKAGDPPLYDCNENRQLDACDIELGISLDDDGDGRPDECEPVCPADFDGDGFVGGSDLGLFLLVWNQANARADLNGDGVVDGVDFGEFLIAWGDCP